MNASFDLSRIFKMILALWIIGAVLYLPVIFYPFVHDDVIFILRNPNIARWDNLSVVFLSVSRQPEIINSYYRPLLEIYYRAGYFFFGFNPLGFHLVNIVIHILNAVLVLGLLLRVGMKERAGFIVALLFLVHPVQTQAVVCISGISNLLMAFFLLNTLHSYLSYKEGGLTLRWFSLAGFLFFSIAAIFSKEQAIILPGLILCFASLKKENLKRLFLDPLFVVSVVVSAGYFLWRGIIAGPQIAGILAYPDELKLRLLAIPQTLFVYLKILFWPGDLHYYRSVNVLIGWIPYAFWMGIMMAFAGFFIRHWENRRYIYGGSLLFLLSLLPVLNIAPLIIEYSYISIAEHFLYFSSIGIFICAVVTVQEILTRYFSSRYELLVWLISMTVTIVLCSVTFAQKTFWRSEVALFERSVNFEPQLARVHVLLGKAYFFQNRFEEGIAQLWKAQKIFEGYLSKAKGSPAEGFYRGYLKGVYFDMAQSYLKLQNVSGALYQYDQARQLDPQDTVVLNNMATVHMQLAQWKEAGEILKEAVEKDPSNVLVLNSLGVCAINQGDAKQAEYWFRQALQKNPRFPSAQENLKRILEEKP